MYLFRLSIFDCRTHFFFSSFISRWSYLLSFSVSVWNHPSNIRKTNMNITSCTYISISKWSKIFWQVFLIIVLLCDDCFKQLIFFWCCFFDIGFMFVCIICAYEYVINVSCWLLAYFCEHCYAHVSFITFHIFLVICWYQIDTVYLFGYICEDCLHLEIIENLLFRHYAFVNHSE